MKKYWLFLMVLATVACIGYRVEAASPNWLQFCDNANVKSKEELIRTVLEWRNCHLPQKVFFARLSGVVGVPIRDLENFRAYVESPSRELVACNWRKGDVEIDHIIRGKSVSFGQSWRACQPGERMLIDWSKPTGNSGRIVLSGWCLNTVHDKRPPIPPPPPPPPPAPALMPPEKTSPWLPPKPEVKPVKVTEEIKCEWRYESNPSPPISTSFWGGTGYHWGGALFGSGVSIGASHRQESCQ